MNIIDQLLANLAILPGHYERDGSAGVAKNQIWQLPAPWATAANRYALLSPSRLSVNINGQGYATSTQVTIDLSVAANWDNQTPDYTQAANRIGMNFYLYACQPLAGSNPVFILSANSTAPTGTPPSGCAAFGFTTTRKIGGFHCLAASVGTISGHTLTGFVAGDILPNSIWDLKFRPAESGPEGMVYGPAIKKWVDIYLASGTGTSTASAYGGAVSSSRNWMDFVDDGAAVSKRLLRDAEFQIVAAGGNEQTNVYGSVNPVSAGKSAPIAQTTGTGLNDLSVDRTGLTGVESQEYDIVIDATGAPDTFKWRSRVPAGSWGAYTTGVAITGGWQTLSNGVKIKFAATTGHTLNNEWGIYVMNGLVDTANRRMISNIGLEGCAGAYYQWLDEQSFRYDIGTPALAAAGQTATMYYAAAPGGNQIYVKFGSDGTPYLCCNFAVSQTDKLITCGSYNFVIKHDASSNTGLPVYFLSSATNPLRLIVNNTIYSKQVSAFANDPNFTLPLTHNAAASSSGVAVSYNETTSHLEAIVPGAANSTIDLATTSPTWQWYTLPGGHGQLYEEGPSGDVKLIAGLSWSYGSNCGSRARYASSYRWYTNTNIGSRFAFELDSQKYILFTGSAILIEQAEKYQAEMPFTATIKKIDRYYTLS